MIIILISALFIVTSFFHSILFILSSLFCFDQCFQRYSCFTNDIEESACGFVNLFYYVFFVLNF